MNTATTSSFNPRIVALSIFVALASTSSLVCSAADGPLQSKVKYGDLNVSSTQGATTLYNRIRVAAENVCHPLDGRDFTSKKLAATCLHDAIAAAVKDVGQSALFAVYNSKTAVSKPIVLASSQAR